MFRVFSKKSDIAKILSVSVAAGIFATLIFRLDINIALFSDFVNYYNGASIVRDGRGSELYNLDTQLSYQENLVDDRVKLDILLPFRNLPFVALILVPLSYLPFIVSYKIFLVGIFLTLLIFSYSLKKIFKGIKKIEYWLLLTFLFFPNLWSILVVQFAPLIALIVLFVYQSVKQKKDMLAGCCSGLLLIKPQYLLIVPFIFFLVKKKKDFVSGLILVLVILLIISTAVSGLNSLISYPSFIIQTERPLYGSRPEHIFTIFSLLKVIFVNYSFVGLFVINGILYVLALLFFSAKHKNVGLDLSFASSILLTIAFSLHTYIQDLSFSLISFFIILNLIFSRKYKGRNALFLLAIFIYLVPFTPFLGLASLMSVIFIGIGLYLLKVNKPNQATQKNT